MLLQVGRSATPRAIADRGSPAQNARAPSAVSEDSFDALGLDVVLGFQVLRAPGTASAELPRLGTAGAPFLPPCVHGLAPQLIISKCRPPSFTVAYAAFVYVYTIATK